MKFLVSQLTALVQGGGRQSNVKLLLRFVLLLLVVITLFSVLFHVLMEHEGQHHSWLTGFYWTLTVMSTLGFGDITFTGDLGRLFSIVVMLSGVIFLLIMLPFTFIRFFYAPWLDSQNKARAPRFLPASYGGHVILTHFNDVAANLVQRFTQLGVESVVLVPELPKALELFDRGYRVMVGDLNDPDTYRNLRIQAAALVVVLNPDIASTNIIYTLREVCAQVPTVTNADDDDSLDILQLAGSTHVFQFHKLLGQALARRVLGVSLRANVVGRFDELLIAETPAMATSLPGQTLQESRLRERSGVNVVGLWDHGAFRLPSPTRPVEASTVLVLAGTEAQLQRFEHVARPERPALRQEGPVLVLGGGRVGQAVAATLAERGVDYRVIEKRPSRRLVEPNLIEGSAADHQVLQAAGIERAPAVILTTHDDDLNIFLTIYCRRLRSDIQIISRASLDRNVSTLHRAGADLVMSYSSITTTAIVNILRPGTLLMLSETLGVFSASVDEHLVGRSLLELRIREQTGCSVVALKRGGETHANPEPTDPLRLDDELVLVGDVAAMSRFTAGLMASPRRK